MNESTKTKKALRGSLFALFICIALLIGTTFAWFTDTASTGVNKIQSGKLDVDLMYSTDGENWTSADGETLDFKKAAGAENEAILWEPGCTYELPQIKVVNNGNLALKYKLEVTGIKGDEKLNEVIDWTIGDEALADVEGNLTANGTSNEMTIKGHMQESAGNEYQGLSIEGISITVYATQDTVEHDSINNKYDKDATVDFTPVSTTNELKTAIENAKAGENVNVSLTGNVTMDEQTLMVADGNTPDVGDIYIQANGHKITNSNNAARCLQVANFTSDRKVTISGAKIVSDSTATDSSERRGVQIFSVNNATVNLVNCDIEMKSKDYSYPVKIGGTSKNLTINITGCTLTGANCIESYGESCTVNITDCVLNSNYAPNETYCGNGIQDKNGKNNTYNIKNTTFNGTNAQQWQTSATTTINDLGGNVDNTTRTKN